MSEALYPLLCLEFPSSGQHPWFHPVYAFISLCLFCFLYKIVDCLDTYREKPYPWDRENQLNHVSCSFFGKQRPGLTLSLPTVRIILNPEPTCSLLLSSHIVSLQLLKGVTIASGGVLPRIHPELLAKKRGTKGKSETILSPPPEKRGRKATSGKKGGKKSKAAKPRTSKKVSLVVSVSPGHSKSRREVEPSKEEDVASISKGLGTCLSLVPRVGGGRKW